MRIKTHLQLSQLEVYVQREPEADKKLKGKDPNAYGLGPTKLHKLNVTQVASTFNPLKVWFSLMIYQSNSHRSSFPDSWLLSVELDEETFLSIHVLN